MKTLTLSNHSYSSNETGPKPIMLLLEVNGIENRNIGWIVMIWRIIKTKSRKRLNTGKTLRGERIGLRTIWFFNFFSFTHSDYFVFSHSLTLSLFLSLSLSLSRFIYYTHTYTHVDVGHKSIRKICFEDVIKFWLPLILIQNSIWCTVIT